MEGIMFTKVIRFNGTFFLTQKKQAFVLLVCV